jgi:hypothetical protein
MKKLSRILFEETDSIYTQSSPPGSTRKSIKDFYLDNNPKFRIYIAAASNREGERFIISLFKEDLRIGYIWVEYQENSGRCLNAMEITNSKVNEKGWGPILYEIALEIASVYSFGLMSDRNTVSQAAQNVWDKFNYRSDVEKFQLDDEYANDNERLTPSLFDDDCQHPNSGSSADNIKFKKIQDRKLENGIIDQATWRTVRTSLTLDPEEREYFLKSSLTKVYKKNDFSTIKNLFNRGLIQFDEFTYQAIKKIGIEKSVKIEESVTLQPPAKGSSRKWLGSFEEPEKKKYFVEIWSDKFPNYFAVSVKLDEGNHPEIGTIEFEKVLGADTGPCLKAYQTKYSKTNEKGWGPVLYEVAIELATIMGGGLMSDRSAVSPSAEKIWTNFLNNSNGNLEVLQLDDYNASADVMLTPDNPEDDCIFPEEGESSAVASLKDIFLNKFERGEIKSRWSGFSPLSKDPIEREKFLNNPLTKVFRASNPTTIKKLINRNLLYLSSGSKKLQSILEFPESFDPYEKNIKKTVSLDR